MDRRGIWAMGAAGSSVLAGYGSTSLPGGGSGYANGPNACADQSDDILDFSDPSGEAATECMGAYSTGGIATSRSLHPNGVNVVFADDSVHFITNAVETSGLNGTLDTLNLAVWDRLICSSDKHPVDATGL
jgi:prepilin-type processing-associated H-X9-DG protein